MTTFVDIDTLSLLYIFKENFWKKVCQVFKGFAPSWPINRGTWCSPCRYPLWKLTDVKDPALLTVPLGFCSSFYDGRVHNTVAGPNKNSFGFLSSTSKPSSEPRCPFIVFAWNVSKICNVLLGGWTTCCVAALVELSVENQPGVSRRAADLMEWLQKHVVRILPWAGETEHFALSGQ